MSSVVALDTNVLIYLHDVSDALKRGIASNLLADNPHIPSQVISEYLNTTRRFLPLSKEALLTQAAALFAGCTIIPVHSDTLAKAAELVKRYQFQLFDAVIVAAALQAGCSILYSEDMHHGLVIESTLTVINPFR